MSTVFRDFLGGDLLRRIAWGDVQALRDSIEHTDRELRELPGKAPEGNQGASRRGASEDLGGYPYSGGRRSAK